MMHFLEKKYQINAVDSIIYSDTGENADGSTPATQVIETRDSITALPTIETHGDTTKPVLIFLHGLGGDLSVFDEFRQKFFKHGYRSIAIDFRGHGLSSKPKKRNFYDFDQLVTDVLEIIQTEKIANYILIGHCLGGLIAQKIAIQAPEGLQKLVLINSTPITYPLFKRIGFSKFIVYLAIILQRMLPTLSIRGRANHKNYIGTGDFYFPRIITDIFHTSVASYGQVLSFVLSYNTLSEISHIRVKTLIISGENDKIFSAQWSKLLHEQIKNSQLLTYKNANHLFLFAQVASVVNDILTFLETADQEIKN